MFRFTPFLIGLALVGCGAPATDTSAPATEEAPAGSESKPAGSAMKADTAVTPVAFNVEGSPVVEFEAPGMHCSACAAHIVKAIKDKPGVVDVKADADTKIVTVAIDESEFEPEAAIAAVEEAGFGEATQVEANAI